MRTAPPSQAPADPAGGTAERPGRLRAFPFGPLLITLGVAVAMRGFLFQDLLSNRHPDILGFWLPRFCFLGRSLAGGDVPLWSPLEAIGTPYVADPQSGWLYAAPMALFSSMGCGTAMRLMIALHPLMAGLGLYWFLRREDLHPVAATAGGLSLALIIGGSSIAISLPFAGALAWTPLVLVGASGFLSASRTSRRLLWLALSAFAWGQVAGAHMSHGLGMATLLVAAFLVARSLRDADTARSVLLAAGFLAFLALSNLAMFLPRLAFVSRSSLGGGYDALADRAAGLAAETLANRGVWAAWPLAFGASPGAYAGAAILLSVPVAAMARSKHHLLAAFGAAAGVTYLLTLDLFVGAGWFRDLVLGLPSGDAYLHNPARLRVLMMLVLPVVGALGLHAFLEHAPARPLRWAVAGVAFFVGLPLALGAHPVRYVLPALGIAATVPVLVGAARGRRWAAPAVALVLAGELLANVLFGQAYSGGTVVLGLEDHVPWYQQEGNLSPGPLRWPQVDAGRYLRPGPIGRYLREHDGRLLPWVPPEAFLAKGYLFSQQPLEWPAMTNGRAMLFGIPSALTYNPVQLPRYWSYVRATNLLPIFYNASVIQQPSPADVRLLGVRYLTVPEGVPSPVSGAVVAREAGFALVEVAGGGPRASLVTRWTRVSGSAAARHEVLGPDFDPSQEAVLEITLPGGTAPSPATPGPASGIQSFTEAGPDEIAVEARATVPSLVVIRNAWDRGWKATVDGRPAPVLVADSFLQAVPVPPGRHRIRLTYEDPWVGRGLLASLLVWSILVAGFVLALVRERRGRAR